MEQFNLTNKDRVLVIDDYLDIYLTTKSPDCILYSQDGNGFKIHKYVLGQTNFLREILSSTKEHCCQTLEILCPCTKEELSHLVIFLYDGEIHCENYDDSLKIQDNLWKIFGFAENLNLTDPTGTLLDNESLLVNNDEEAVKITEKAFENIPDQFDTEKNFQCAKDGKSNQGESKIEFQCIFDAFDYISNTKSKLKGSVGRKPLEKKQLRKSSLTKVLHKEGKNENNKTFPCNDCEDLFKSEYHLKVHVSEVHLKIKPHECKMCKKSFTRKHYMEKHVAMFHKKFKCNDCDATFHLKYLLKSHVDKTHLKKKTLKKVPCSKCKTSFETKQQLDCHMKTIHVNNVPYKCDFCEMSFEKKIHLRCHNSAAHHKNAHKCEKCEKTFSQKSSLKTHMNIKHSD